MPTLPRHAYHLADAQNWEAIRLNGLLTTQTLLTRGGLDARTQTRAHRRDTTFLPDGVVIRDQRPMPPSKLARCLDPGLTPEDWFAQLNSAVFFWLDERRLKRLLGAQRRAMVLLTFDAFRLADAYGQHAFVTPFNSGAALYDPAARPAHLRSA